MEPEVRQFLKRIVSTISAGLIWMILNTFFGLVLGFAIIQEGHAAASILFYLWLSASLVFLIYYLRKIWKGHI